MKAGGGGGGDSRSPRGGEDWKRRGRAWGGGERRDVSFGIALSSQIKGLARHQELQVVIFLSVAQIDNHVWSC